MSYISIKNYSQLSKLPAGDIIEMMMQGINFLDGSIVTFVSQVKSVEQEIMHNAESLNKLKETMKKSSFKIKSEDEILEVVSTGFPPSLFFAFSDWEKELSKHSEYKKDAFILIPHRSRGTLFISDEKTILRLSDSFEGIYDILSIEDVKSIKI